MRIDLRNKGGREGNSACHLPCAARARLEGEKDEPKAESKTDSCVQSLFLHFAQQGNEPCGFAPGAGWPSAGSSAGKSRGRPAAGAQAHPAGDSRRAACLGRVSLREQSGQGDCRSAEGLGHRSGRRIGIKRAMRGCREDAPSAPGSLCVQCGQPHGHSAAVRTMAAAAGRQAQPLAGRNGCRQGAEAKDQDQKKREPAPHVKFMLHERRPNRGRALTCIIRESV